MAYEELKPSGITSTTPANIMLGAGTIHSGLTYTAPSSGSSGTTGGWNFAESLVGATSGGTKLTITPEFTDVEVDGATVKVKGLAVKTGETATIETNFVELTPELMKMLAVAKDGTSTITGYDVIESKPKISSGDYIENFGYVGHKLDGTPVIIIFDNALCTSGLEIEGKNKENGVFKGTFECYADITSDCDSLPYHIYTPTT